jgi:hypothetical protein
MVGAKSMLATSAEVRRPAAIPGPRMKSGTFTDGS